MNGMSTVNELHRPNVGDMEAQPGGAGPWVFRKDNEAMTTEKSTPEEHDPTRDSEVELAKNTARFGKLPDHLRAIRVRNNIDMLMVVNPFDENLFRVGFCVVIEIFKVIVFYATIERNIRSCAIFSPVVLLVGGLFNLFQIAVMATKKLVRALYVVTYDENHDNFENLVMRAFAVVGLGIVEVLFITATFWVMNTIDNLLDAITNGLALLIVSNLDEFVFQYITLEVVAHKTGKHALGSYSNYIEVGQIVVVMALFGVLYLIAISVAASDHSNYHTEYCT